MTRILATAAVLLITGCQAWHEPPLEPVAVGPPVKTVILGPPVCEGPVGEGPVCEAPICEGPPAILGPPIDPHCVPESAVVGPIIPVPSQPPIGPPPDAFGPPAAAQNPMIVPVTNHEVAWREIVDVVDDYFRIAREKQVQNFGGVWTEGQIETYPQGGATLVEPHRRDSVGRFNRWESTLQTIRRTAMARVVPTGGGYMIEMIVEKELEDLPRPEHATAGAATYRSDDSLPSDLTKPVSQSELSASWIPLGRDPALEQQMLADIRARLDVTPAGVVY